MVCLGNCNERTALHVELEKGKLALDEGRFSEALGHFEAGADNGSEKGLFVSRFYSGLVKAKGLVVPEGLTPEQVFFVGLRDMIKVCYSMLNRSLLNELRCVLQYGVSQNFVTEKKNKPNMKIELHDISCLLHGNQHLSGSTEEKDRLGYLLCALNRYLESERR